MRLFLAPLFLTALCFPGSAQSTLNLSQDLIRLGIAPSNMAPNQPLLDAGPLFLAGVNYAASKQISSVIADPGAYYFLSAQNSVAHVQISQANTMTIDLQGSDLYFTQPKHTGLYVTGSSNLVVQNFSMDYQPLQFTQLQIVSVNPAQRQFQYTIMQGYRDPSFLNAYYNGAPYSLQIHMFRNGRPAPNLFVMEPVTPIGGNTITIAPDVTGYATNQVLAQIRPGDVAVLNADIASVTLAAYGCTGCTFRNIRIYSNSWVVSYSPSMTMERVYMMPRPGTDRLTTAGASLWTGPGANGIFRLLRSIRATDDAFNWHIEAAGIVQSQSGRSLVVQGDGGQNSYLGSVVTLPNGATVAFESPDGTVRGSAVIASQTPKPAAPPFQVTFTFDRDLPSNLTGTMVYATDANEGGSNFLIERSAAVESYRGFVISGLEASTVSGNYTRRTFGSGIDAEHAVFQAGGYPPDVNLSVSRHVIDMADLAPDTTDQFATFGGIQVLAARAVPPPALDSTSPMQNISIAGNFIANPGSSAVWLGNTNVGSIHDNYFLNPNDNPWLNYQFQPFLSDFTMPLAVRNSVNINTSNNTVDQTSGRMWVTDTQFNELAAYAPGSTYRLNAYNLGTLSSPTVTLTDADGKTTTLAIQKTSTHYIDVQLAPTAGLGGAYLTLASGSTMYFGTLFIDSQDNIPALNGCTYELSPSSTYIPASSSVSILVVTQSGCAYTVTDSDSSVSVSGPGTGTGVATVTANATTTVEIAGVPITFTLSPVIQAIVDSWGYTAGIAPGTWVSIGGTNLAAGAPETWNLNGVQNLPTTLGGVTVTFNGTPAALYYVGATQINALVPASVVPGSVKVVVQSSGVSGPPFTITATASQPAVYAPPSADGTTFFVTAALAGTGTLVGNSTTDPRVIRAAQPGDTLDLYMIGLGATADPSKFVTDKVFSGAFPVSTQVTATMGGENAPVLFAGLTSPGLYLVRISVPSNLPAGPQALTISAGTGQTRSSLVLMVGSAP